MDPPPLSTGGLGVAEIMRTLAPFVTGARDSSGHSIALGRQTLHKVLSPMASYIEIQLKLHDMRIDAARLRAAPPETTAASGIQRRFNEEFGRLTLQRSSLSNRLQSEEEEEALPHTTFLTQAAAAAQAQAATWLAAAWRSRHHRRIQAEEAEVAAAAEAFTPLPPHARGQARRRMQLRQRRMQLRRRRRLTGRSAKRVSET